jgi:protein-tyrosine phosphatase
MRDLMNKYLTHAALIALSFATSSAMAQQAITTPVLTSAANFRDLAGPDSAHGGSGVAETTSENGFIRTGTIYRSNALALTDADLATLSRLGITEVIDLRTPSEASKTPDRVPPGAHYTNINIFASDELPKPNLDSEEAAIAFLQATNREFVTNAEQRKALAAVLHAVINSRGPVVFNCTAGKDRTGWVSALLQSIAGVPEVTILADYLASNSYNAKSNEAYAQYGVGIQTVMNVQAADLQAGLDQIVTSYGSMNGYLTKGLGLTEADIKALRRKMVMSQQ